MMDTRVNLLQLVQQQTIDQLNPLIQKHKSKRDPLNLTEDLDQQIKINICQEIRVQVQNLTGQCILNDSEDVFQQSVAAKLKCFAELIQILMSGGEEGKNDEVLKELGKAVVILHDNCLLMAQAFIELMKVVEELCTNWYCMELPYFQDVGVQTIMVSLSCAINDYENVHYVKNAHKLRHVLKTVDYEDESSTDIKKLLLRSFIGVNFLQVQEGREFLQFVMDLTPSLICEIYEILKSQLPFIDAGTARFFGQIILQGWMEAQDGNCCRAIERDIFQKSMQAALLVKNKQLAATLRNFLAPLHEKNRDGIQLVTSALMFKCYSPIIYRHLDAPNPDVRINALNLLKDIFPLLDFNQDQPQREELVRKQVLLPGGDAIFVIQEAEEKLSGSAILWTIFLFVKRSWILFFNV